MCSIFTFDLFSVCKKYEEPFRNNSYLCECPASQNKTNLMKETFKKPNEINT